MTAHTIIDTTTSAPVSAPIRADVQQALLSLEAHLPLEGTKLARSEAFLRHVLLDAYAGQTAVVSSFGAESAVLLHLISRIDRATPVLFLDTDRHFYQTLSYRDQLVRRLNLSTLIVLHPDAEETKAEDPDNRLFKRDPDACCDLRKVRPLTRALSPYRAWISGRKRHHGGPRADLPFVEHDGAHLKLNPLAEWSAEDLAEHIQAYDLPPHPLVAEGYLSIGCHTCTAPSVGNDPRSGRWAGQEKSECGIHRQVVVRPRPL